MNEESDDTTPGTVVPGVAAVEKDLAISEGRLTQIRLPVSPQPPSEQEVKKLSGARYGFIPWEADTPWWVASGPVWAVRKLMQDVSPDERPFYLPVPAWKCPLGAPGELLTLATKDKRLAPRGFEAIVRDVRMERLGLVSVADAIAEGIDVPDVDYSVPDHPYALENERAECARRKLIERWDEHHGEGQKWADEIWVWVVRFELVEHAFIREYDALCRKYDKQIVHTDVDMFGVDEMHPEEPPALGELSTSYLRRRHDLRSEEATARYCARETFRYSGVQGHVLYGDNFRRIADPADHHFQTREQRVDSIERKLGAPRLLTAEERRAVLREVVDEQYDLVERKIAERTEENG